jgi:site-specific DNA recombinase
MSLEMFNSFIKGYDKNVKVNKDVWIYTRVSSKDQESNKSLQNQLDSANRLIQEKQFVASKIFGGTYESASGDFTRKEFKKLFDAIRESKNRPYAIILNTINRFSRTGGGGVSLAYELVEKLGVHLIEVTTKKSTETEDGKLEIYRGLIHAKQENIDRLKITIPGMKKFLEEGNWLGRVPRGYDHYGPRVKGGKYSEVQKITLNSEGKTLQQAWQGKLQGERDFIIEDKLTSLGLKKLNKQFLSQMWRNPFYCGVCSQKMLDGKVVKGNWEKMVSEDDFLTVQQILKGNRQGYKQDKANPERPLNAFICCSKCGGKLAGYEVKKKKKHYYKCQTCIGISINANTTIKAKGDGAHDLFVKLLNDYTLKDSMKVLYKTQLKLTYDTLNKESSNESQGLKKELEKQRELLMNLERRYATDIDFDKEVYRSMKSDFMKKINELNVEIGKCETKISNLDKYIEVSELVAKNISKHWCSESLETKRRVQELVFKGGLSLDVKNRTYLTKEVNYVFELNAELTGSTEAINDKRQLISQLPSSLVAGTRLERATFGL